VNILTAFNIAVQVILKAVDPKLKSKFCDRYIFLTKDNPKIFIGRSTRRDARLAAGAKNGWFDSAVMSRNHAKIVYLPANNVSWSRFFLLLTSVPVAQELFWESNRIDNRHSLLPSLTLVLCTGLI
jgi:hypothetical protein